MSRGVSHSAGLYRGAGQGHGTMLIRGAAEPCTHLVPLADLRGPSENFLGGCNTRQFLASFSL